MQARKPVPMRFHLIDLSNETDRTFVLNKDYAFKEDLLELVEVSENDPGNDENHENHENVFRKDVNAISERRFISKAAVKKRQGDNATSETCESRVDFENEIVARNRVNSNGLPRKRQPKGHSDNPETEIEHHNNVYRKRKVTARRRICSRKRTRKDNMSSNTMFEDENCDKDSYLSITCKKQNLKGGVKRRADTMSSEVQDSEVECALSGRVSPTIMATSELEQRRSSIEFQPVVRMMKIEDQVEMDHSILSVTVASNRRLRSSSSPRSNVQPPKKRLKTSKGQFGRWLKSS